MVKANIKITTNFFQIFGKRLHQMKKLNKKQ